MVRIGKKPIEKKIYRFLLVLKGNFNKAELKMEKIRCREDGDRYVMLESKSLLTSVKKESIGFVTPLYGGMVMYECFLLEPDNIRALELFQTYYQNKLKEAEAQVKHLSEALVLLDHEIMLTYNSLLQESDDSVIA